MELEGMKSQWRSANENIRLGSELKINENRRTALDRLARRYRSFAILATGLIFFFPPQLALTFHIPVWMIVWFILIMAASAITDYYLTYLVKRIDVATMPLNKVVEQTLKCRRIHLIFVAVNMPLALGFCGAFAYYCKADPYIISGIICGAILGLIMGLIVLFNFLRDYRRALSA